MRNGDLFGYREGASLDVASGEIKRTLGEMKPVLDEGLKRESVIGNSIDNISSTYSAFDVPSNPFASDGAFGDAQSKSKVRVLTPNNNGPVKPNVVPVEDNFASGGRQYVDTSNFSSTQGSSTSWLPRTGSGGSVQTLILIYTAILVALVMFVSLVVINFFGS